MVQDTRRRSQYYIAETTSREKQVNPRLDLTMLNVEAGRDNTRFVETTIKLDYNLARTMVIDNGKFTNVAMTLHDAKEFDNDLGRGTNKNLTLSTALSVDNIVKTVIQDGYADHFLRCRG